MRYNTILWDLDGTLLDTLDDLADSVNAALLKNDFPTRSREEIRSFVGNGMRRLIARAVPDGTSEADEARVRGDFEEHYRIHCNDKTKPYDGILPLLRRLHQAGVTMAIVSNKPDFAVRDLAKQYFDGLVDAAVGARDGVPTKPARDVIDLTLATLGRSGEGAVYIGDSEVDVATARAADLSGIAVSWGFRDEAVLRAAGAGQIAATVAALETMLG